MTTYAPKTVTIADMLQVISTERSKYADMLDGQLKLATDGLIIEAKAIGAEEVISRIYCELSKLLNA